MVGLEEAVKSGRVWLTGSGWCLPGSDSYFHKFQTPLEYDGDPQPDQGKNNGFQRHHLWCAFEFVQKWDVAIDVGAHCGYWAWDMAERFKKVHCFEAHPVTAECLRYNMGKFDNVSIYNAAVGDQKGKVTIERDSTPKRQGNSGSNFVMPDKDYGNIRMYALDDMEFRGCDLLKIDVEGFEEMVLRGAEKLITEHWPVVVMETDKRFHGRYDKLGLDGQGASDWLTERGYEVKAAMRPDKIFVRPA